MKKDILTLFQAARQVSVPVLGIRTADQVALVEEIRAKHNEFPLCQWDSVRGLSGVNKAGEAALEKAGLKGDDTVGFAEAMVAARLLPQKAVVFAHNAHRQLQSSEPAATAQNVQAVANLREPFKRSFRMLVMLGPVMPLPSELEQDVVLLEHELPGPEALEGVVRELHVSAKLRAPDKADMGKAVDAVSGLSMFAADQAVAMSLGEGGLDHDALWDRKRTAIEQTDGLSVYRGGERLTDLRGLASVKARLLQHREARTPVGVVVWIDEGADVFSNVESDTSGVKTDQQRALLVEMEQNGWRGMAFVGVPGSGKSALARAFGNEVGVPTIQVDFGAMESKYVGESEAKLRTSLKVIKAIGRGNAFFVLTANSLRGIRPQFQARFRRGTFFFDLPTAAERDAIWQLYLKRYGIAESKANPRPDDTGWVGREIRECCESAWDCGITLAQAAAFIVPVSRSRATEIEAMRREAHGRFLDASHAGSYQYREEPMADQVRAIELPQARSSRAVN